jgi:hypothetical protein
MSCYVVDTAAPVMHYSFSFRNLSSTDTTLASSGCEDLESDPGPGAAALSPTRSDATSVLGASHPSCCHSIRPHFKSCELLLCLAAILAALIAAMIFIGVPVVMSGQYKQYVCMKNLTKNESFQMADLSPLVVSDLSLGEHRDDEEGQYHLFLYDAVGFHQVDVKQQQQQKHRGTNETAPNTTTTASHWNAVQPTGGSLLLMDRLPHIRTGPRAFLELSPTFDLRSDRNWTLSFAGARLQPSSRNGGGGDNDNHDIILSSSLFPSCRIQYEADNTLGMYLTSIRSGRAETMYHGGIVLPDDVFEFHVLTWTFDQESQRMDVYQNEDLVAAVDFEDGWVALNLIGSSARVVVEDENDTTTATSSTFSSSNLAIRRMSYFHESFHGDDLAELALYMRW